jgi:hypothetical protein
MATFEKIDVGVMDYGINYTEWLGTDTIATSSWEVDEGLTLDSSSFTDTLATIRTSGGTVGNSYQASNTITTASGLKDCRYITISIIECR